jgi:hypothetical protein
MPRLIQTTHGYLRGAARLKVEGTSAGKKLARMINTLAAAETLPGPNDTVGILPPSATAWVCRVTGTSLWLWYQFSDEVLTLKALTNAPPPS